MQTDYETLERTKHQLYLILHAIEFQKERDNNNNNANDRTQTPLLCESMKAIFNHMNNTGKSIEDRSTQHNSSFCQVINHTSTCKVSNCSVCAKQQQESNCCQQSDECYFNTDAIESLSANVQNVREQASNVYGADDWHHCITQDLRNHLVDKQIEAILPKSYQGVTHDERIHKMIEFTKKCEEALFEKANSKTEYYYLLADKIFYIKNELKVKRQKRKLDQSDAASLSSTDTVSHQTRSFNQNQIDVMNLDDEQIPMMIQQQVKYKSKSFSEN